MLPELEVIAGYDPKDELTAFSIGRLPSEPYRSFANERTLNGLRIGVIREHMDKKSFNEADVEAIDLVERAIGDLRRLGATIVDPGPKERLLQSCIDRYFPIYRNRMFIAGFPDRFPWDASGNRQPTTSLRSWTFRSIAGAFGHHDPEHRRRRQSRPDQPYAEPLLERARRCEHQVHQGSDR